MRDSVRKNPTEKLGTKIIRTLIIIIIPIIILIIIIK